MAHHRQIAKDKGVFAEHGRADRLGGHAPGGMARFGIMVFEKADNARQVGRLGGSDLKRHGATFSE